MNIETWKELKIFENKILQSNDEVKELTVYFHDMFRTIKILALICMAKDSVKASWADNGELGNIVPRLLRPLTDSLDGYLLIDFPVYPFKILNFENHTIESHFPALY